MLRPALLLALALCASPARAGQEPAPLVPAGLRADDWNGIRAAWTAGRHALTPLEQTYLKATSTDAFDNFGWSVAASGNTVVIGAPNEDSAATGVNGDPSDDSLGQSGAAWVFVHDGTSWSQQAYLKASNTGGGSFPLGDRFGQSVAISGDTIVVGAYGEGSNATGVNGNQSNNDAFESGAAYVFVRNGTSWSQEAYLKASNTAQAHWFGYSVAISADTVVVGAPQEGSLPNFPAAGAAYVFVRAGSSWSQQAFLKASNASYADRFGTSVAVSGGTVVVAAPGEDDIVAFSNSGAAYVFVRNEATWSQEAYLRASNFGVDDLFGSQVTISGDTLVVGAAHEDSSASGVNGDQDDNSAASSGAAYVFTRSGSTWSQEAYLKASNTGPGDQFGSSVALSDDTLLVGACREDSSASGVDGEQDDDGALDSGAAYLFTRNGTTWSQESYLKSSASGAEDWFGLSVAVSGDTLACGAPNEDSAATGVNGDPGNDDLLSSGAAFAFRTGFQASVASRNAGANPASYAAAPIAIGGTFTATVDNNLSAQLTSRLIAFEAPTSFALSGGQTLLCLDLGSGELFAGSNLAPVSSAGGVDSYSLAVPDLPALAGFAFCSQAIQFGSPPFVLSNAQDFTVGGL